MRQAFLLLGEILRPQGIKGEVKIRHWSGHPEQFMTRKTVYFKNNDEYIPVNIAKARLQGEDVFLHLEGIEDRNAAEALRGKEIWIDREHAGNLAEGENYIAELIGTPVYLPDGAQFGEVKDIISTGHVDVFVVKVTGGEWSFPALKTVLRLISPEKIILDYEKLQEVGLYEDCHS